MARKRRQQQIFARAVQAHAEGRLSEAARGYRQLLAKRPRDAEVLHQLGLVCWQQGQLPEAQTLLERSVALSPRDGRAWSNLGHIRQAVGKPEAAIDAYQRALQDDPGRPALWSGMGVALQAMGRQDEAIAALQKAAAIPDAGPSIWQNLGSALSAAGRLDEAVEALKTAIARGAADGETHNALGNVYLEQGAWTSAEAAYRAALRVAPGSAMVHTNLGLLMHRQGQVEAAMDAFEAAIAADPAYVDAYTHFGLLLRSQGHIEPAIATWQRGLSIRPTAAAWLNLSCALLELGHQAAGVENLRGLLAMFPDDVPALLALGGAQSVTDRAEAIRLYERVLSLSPGHAEATHFLDALQERAPQRAPAAYVRQLFDDYAVRFEQHLVDELGYQTPQRLAAQIAAHHSGALEKVGDLGCGTGLMGALLRPQSSTLIGVDLSAEMVNQARQKGLYDALHVGEIEAVLPALGGGFSLLVAADVLIYVGDLSGLFAAVAEALAPGGLFALTTEHLDGEGWRLLESGRYAHSHATIAGLAESVGLTVRASSVEPIRKEHGAWIDGELFVLQR